MDSEIIDDIDPVDFARANQKKQICRHDGVTFQFSHANDVRVLLGAVVLLLGALALTPFLLCLLAGSFGVSFLLSILGLFFLGTALCFVIAKCHDNVILRFRAVTVKKERIELTGGYRAAFITPESLSELHKINAAHRGSETSWTFVTDAGRYQFNRLTFPEFIQFRQLVDIWLELHGFAEETVKLSAAK